MKVDSVERFVDSVGRSRTWHTLSLACNDCDTRVGAVPFDGTNWSAELRRLGLMREHGYVEVLRRVDGVTLRLELCPACAAGALASTEG